MKKLFALSILVSLAFGLYSQIVPTWVHTQNGTGENSDKYYKVCADAVGNYYASGYSVISTNYKDALLVKFNSFGDTLWTKTVNGLGDGDDKFTCLSTDTLGNVFAAGVIDNGITSNDIIVQKYSSAGVLIYSYQYNYAPYNGNDEPSDMVVDNAGNVTITGKSDRDSTSITNNDCITFRLSSAGSLVWFTRFNAASNGDDEGVALDRDNSGNIFVCGTTFNGTDNDILAIKYNSSGVQQWNHTLDRGIGNDAAVDGVKDGGGNFLIAAVSDNLANKDFAVVKYNSAGTLQWSNYFNNADNDNPSAIAVDASNNVYITGQSDQIAGTGSNYDCLLVKYNSAGTGQWVKYFDNAVHQDDDINSIVIDGSSNIYLTGKTDSDAVAASTNNALLVLKYNSSGTLQWSSYSNGTAPFSSDQGTAMCISGTTLFVAGNTENITTQKDATIIKYNMTTGSKLWTRNYNGQGDFNDKTTTMVMDKNNNMFSTGYVTNSGNDRDFFVEKVDVNGNSVWFKTFDFKGARDEASSIALDTSGYIYVAGFTNGSGSGNDFAMLKLTPLGDTVWTRTFDSGLKNDVATSICPTLSGSFVYVTGYSDRSATLIKNYDITTIRISAAGVLGTPVYYNGYGNATDKGVKIISSGSSVFVIGKTTNASATSDVIAIKYSASLVQVWATVYNGPDNLDDEPNDFIVDATNLYITGYVNSLTGMENALTLKLNSSGVQQWASIFAGAANRTDKTYAIKSNSSGVFVCGRIGVSVADSGNVLLIKYDKNSGAQLWFSSISNSGNSYDKANDISLDQYGTVYASGITTTATGSDMFMLGVNGANGYKKMFSVYNGSGNGDDELVSAYNSTTGYFFAAGYLFGSSNTQKNIALLRFCPLTVAYAGNDVSVCSGSSTTLNGSGGTSFLWSPASSLSSSSISNPVAHPSATVSYQLTVDNGLTCGAVGKDTVVVTVNPKPSATITAGGSLTICNGTFVTLTANAGTGYTYQWYLGTAVIPGATAISYNAGAAGSYKVRVYNSYGCYKNSTPKTVSVIACKLIDNVSDNESSLFSVVPNPSSSSFIFSVEDNELVTLRVYNVLGQLILENQNISGLQFGNDFISGMYLVDIELNGVHHQLKIIKTD